MAGRKWGATIMSKSATMKNIYCILFSVGYIIYIAAIFNPRWCMEKEDNLASLLKDDFDYASIFLYGLYFGICSVALSYVVDIFKLYPDAWSDSSNRLLLGIFWILSSFMNFCVLTCVLTYSYMLYFEDNNDEETGYKEDAFGIKKTLVANGIGSLKSCYLGSSYYAGWLGSHMMFFGGLIYVWIARLMRNDERRQLYDEALSNEIGMATFTE